MRTPKKTAGEEAGVPGPPAGTQEILTGGSTVASTTGPGTTEKSEGGTPAPRPAAGRSDAGRANGHDVPPCPAEDPMAGDKTPEVVAWWFKHHPEEAEKRYAGRKVTRPPSSAK